MTIKNPRSVSMWQCLQFWIIKMKTFNKWSSLFSAGIRAFLDIAGAEPWSALVTKLHVSLPSQC